MSASTPRRDVTPEGWTDPAASYDVVAAPYAATFVHELDSKPFDRDLLTRFAGAVGDRGAGVGPVCDLGCGPGHIGAFVAEQGATVFGLDRSRGMVAQARLHAPAMAMVRGDMRALGLRSRSLRGIVCFYALIHIPRVDVPAVLDEMGRVLTDGGQLLLAVHGGEGSLHATEMVTQPVDLDATLFSLAELAGMVRGAGFGVVEQAERAPYRHEHPTPRLYLWAARPT